MNTTPPELRPIGTWVDFETVKDGQVTIYHYQVAAHTAGLDGKLTELLQLHSTDTRAAQVGPTVTK